VGREARNARLAEGLVLGLLLGFFARDLDLGSAFSLRWDRVLQVAAATLAALLLTLVGFARCLRAATLLLGGLWLLVALGPVSDAMCDGLVRRDPLEPADAIFVLGSSVQKDDELTTDATSRLLHGLELLGQGLASRLIVSELRPPQGRHAAAARRAMERLRLEAELIAVGPVRTTREEALLVGRLCRERGFRRLLVVTSPLHSRRACAALEREGVATLSSPGMETRFDLEALDHPSQRLLAFGAALHERLGLLVYRWRGWLPEGS
jgi:uncharacterized SAM-binding protein YcdF (DUF218 family)